MMRQHVLTIAVLLVGLPAAGFAQDKKFEITDNSFFEDDPEEPGKGPVKA